MAKWFPLAFWTLTFLLTVVLSVQFAGVESQKAKLRQDLAVLQEVRYGLFNVDEWKAVIRDIITAKIDEFELEEGNRAGLQAQIEGLLTTLVSELEQSYYEDRSSSLIGILQGATSSILGVFNQMKKDIPAMAETIVTFLDDPENREKIRTYLMDTVDEYAAETFGETDYAAVDEILQRRGMVGPDRSERMHSAAAAIEARLSAMDEAQRPLKWLGLAVLLATALGMAYAMPSHVEVKLAVASIMAWLTVGISMPMLLIQAKVDQLEFQLLGEPILFTDQVLFYQSKSILDVVRLLLIEGKDFGAFFAGLGVLLFSIVVPLLKLGATAAWRAGASWSTTPFGKLVLFRSAKWAMADVMVVAIFLSYLGFKGVLKDQVQRLENVSPRLDVLTTADSTLLPGFMAFLTFALLGLLLSTRLKRMDEEGPDLQR
jgi:hypothetical protein